MRILKRRHEYGSKEHETRQKKEETGNPRFLMIFGYLVTWPPQHCWGCPLFPLLPQRCPDAQCVKFKTLAKPWPSWKLLGAVLRDTNLMTIPIGKFMMNHRILGVHFQSNPYIYWLICQHARELVEREFGWCWSPVDVAERSNPTILQIYLFIYLFKPLIFGG
jgi:hypothetical protein